MPKLTPYSFSKINTFVQCPRKFKYTYIDKLPQAPTDMTALWKGSALHSILENYPNPGTHKLSEKYQPIIDKFLKSRFKHYLDRDSVNELAIGLTEDLEPCKYSKQAMFRGYIDYFTIIDDVMHLLDWKSGKMKEPRFQDYTQLMYYAIYMFKKYSKLNKIRISYVYIEHDYENSLMMERQYLDTYEKQLSDTIKDVESSEYEKCETRLCDWCAYQEYCNKDI